MFGEIKVGLFAAPSQTRALLDQKVRSLDTIDDFWYNRLDEGGDWPRQIACADLYAEYLKVAAQIGVGRKRGQAEFGKRLVTLVPGLRKFRPAIEVAPGVTKQVWCYEVPPLHECRAAFDELLGQPVDWPSLPPAKRAQQAPPDDAPI
jgi:hypothetical protein